MSSFYLNRMLVLVLLKVNGVTTEEELLHIDSRAWGDDSKVLPRFREELKGYSFHSRS